MKNLKVYESYESSKKEGFKLVKEAIILTSSISLIWASWAYFAISHSISETRDENKKNFVETSEDEVISMLDLYLLQNETTSKSVICEIKFINNSNHEGFYEVGTDNLVVLSSDLIKRGYTVTSVKDILTLNELLKDKKVYSLEETSEKIKNKRR